MLFSVSSSDTGSSIVFGGTSFRNGAPNICEDDDNLSKAAGSVGESSVQLQIGLLLWEAWVGLTVLSALAFSSRVATVARAYFLFDARSMKFC